MKPSNRRPVPGAVLQGGIAASALLVLLLAGIMTGAGPVGRAAHAVFAAGLWRPLSELSYSAYLYHEQVLECAHGHGCCVQTSS